MPWLRGPRRSNALRLLRLVRSGLLTVVSLRHWSQGLGQLHDSHVPWFRRSIRSKQTGAVIALPQKWATSVPYRSARYSTITLVSVECRRSPNRWNRAASTNLWFAGSSIRFGHPWCASPTRSTISRRGFGYATYRMSSSFRRGGELTSTPSRNAQSGQ